MFTVIGACSKGQFGLNLLTFDVNREDLFNFSMFQAEFGLPKIPLDLIHTSQPCYQYEKIGHVYGNGSDAAMVRNLYKNTVPLLLAGLVLAASAFNSYATRPDARQLTCEQAQGLVKANGAIVFTFTDTTYDRIVKSSFYCDRRLKAQPFFTKTRDRNRCYIGGKCKEPIFKFNRWGD